MVTNVSSINSSQQVNLNTSTQDIQRQNVEQAKQYGYINKNETSTHNLYHASNLENKLINDNIASQIIRNAKLDKTLDNRIFKELNAANSNNVPMLQPQALDDLYKKLMNLHSSGQLRNLMKAFNRRAHRAQSTDQAYGSSNIKEEHLDLSEKEKVKRKEGQTINQETINDVLKEFLNRHDSAVQRFLLLSMTVQNPTGDKKFDEAVAQELETLYKNNGVEIKAKINSLDEASLYGNGDLTKTTQFSETYYQLVQCQSWMQVFSILKECSSLEEFDHITNLMNISANKDAHGKTLPTSDPNTIHNLISFMNIRSILRSFCKDVDKFKYACSQEAKKKRKTKFLDNPSYIVDPI